MEPEELRQKFVELVASYVDCGVATDQARFTSLVAPGETPTVAREMALDDSTCGLAARGWLALFGLVDPRLSAPYKPGHVISDLVAMAREADALIHVAELEAADILVLSAPEHVLVVEDIDEGALSTIQGGERDTVHHEQQVQRIARTLRASFVDGRPIEFCISLPLIAQSFIP